MYVSCSTYFYKKILKWINRRIGRPTVSSSRDWGKESGWSWMRHIFPSISFNLEVLQKKKYWTKWIESHWMKPTPSNAVALLNNHRITGGWLKPSILCLIWLAAHPHSRMNRNGLSKEKGDGQRRGRSGLSRNSWFSYKHGHRYSLSARFWKRRTQEK